MPKVCKQNLVLFVILVMAAFSTGAIGQDLELRTPGELSVATEGTYPPFSMVDEDGELDGLEIRLVREIAHRLGLEYKPVIIKWDSVLVGLFAGQYDMISAAMDITEERQSQVTFSDGWLESGGRLVVRNDSTITAIGDIEGRVVGALLASTWEDAAKELGARSVMLYKAESDGLQDLANGNIDGVVTDSIAAAFAIQESNLPLRIVEGYISNVQKGFAFRNDTPNLTRAVNAALADIIADGTYADLVMDLVGYDPAPANPIPSNVGE